MEELTTIRELLKLSGSPLLQAILSGLAILGYLLLLAFKKGWILKEKKSSAGFLNPYLDEIEIVYRFGPTLRLRESEPLHEEITNQLEEVLTSKNHCRKVTLTLDLSNTKDLNSTAESFIYRLIQALTKKDYIYTRVAVRGGTRFYNLLSTIRSEVANGHFTLIAIGGNNQGKGAPI